MAGTVGRSETVLKDNLNPKENPMSLLAKAADLLLGRTYAAMEPDPEDHPRNVCNRIRDRLEYATEFGQAKIIVMASLNDAIHLIDKLEMPASRRSKEAFDCWELTKRLIADAQDSECFEAFANMAHDKLGQLQELLR